MPDDPQTLRKATPEDVQDALAFALTFDGKKQFRPSSEMMAKITARHLMEHLEGAGFVLMKKPPKKSFSPYTPSLPLKD